jgi:hypothetical protein
MLLMNGGVVLLRDVDGLLVGRCRERFVLREVRGWVVGLVVGSDFGLVVGVYRAVRIDVRSLYLDVRMLVGVC